MTITERAANVEERIINIGDPSQAEAIIVQWGNAKVVLAASSSSLALDLAALDDLLDALHEARRFLDKTDRMKVIMRIPPELKDALEAKARREGVSQNQAFTEAIEIYTGT